MVGSTLCPEAERCHLFPSSEVGVLAVSREGSSGTARARVSPSFLFKSVCPLLGELISKSKGSFLQFECQLKHITIFTIFTKKLISSPTLFLFQDARLPPPLHSLRNLLTATFGYSEKKQLKMQLIAKRAFPGPFNVVAKG